MKRYKFLIAFTLLGVLASCEFPDNVNPKEAGVVPATALFTNAEVALVNQVNSISQNNNISRLLAQYNAQTTYYGESQWNFMDRSLPDRMWQVIYRDILNDFKEVRRLVNLDLSINSQVKTNRIAIIDILEVYVYHVLVDVNGNVPYSQALLGRENPNPVYDDAATIYANLINRLTANVANLDIDEESFGTADVIYNGDVESWRLFANSLKLRLAMRLADVNPAFSQTNAEDAVASGVFSNQTQSAALHYFGITPHVNSIYAEMVEAGRRDFVAANTIVDIMNDLNDPRRPFYFTQVDTSTTSGEVKLAYVGGLYGYRNVYGQCSTFPASMREAKFPAVLMDFVEVKFLLAEAIARTYNVGPGTVQSLYNEAIIESILDWGGTSVEALDYIAQIEVGFNTGTNANDYKRKIGLQKWLALYNRGLEGWAEWRRFDYPEMNVPRNGAIENFPMRMPYPYNEDNLNLTNYNAASSAIGGDLATTPLFWDIFDINGDPR